MSIWDTLRARDDAQLKALIASKAVDVNESGSGDQTPLHLASELNAKECVATLLSSGASVGVEDGQLRTPLLLACESRAFESAKILIEAKAPLGARDKNDMTPLHWMAAHGASSALIKLALQHGASIDAVNYQFQSPLWYAVTKAQFGAAAALVDAGASLAIDDGSSGTMMHLAMQYGGGLSDSEESLALLTRLLKVAKADATAKDREKRTPLHWASGRNSLPCVKALIAAGADVNARDYGEHTPLHWAAPMDALESCEELVKAGAQAAVADRDKRTPLHWAADRGADRCLKYLLNECDAQVDAVDWGGYTALHSAARRGALGSIQILLAKGANANLAALSGETPADVAQGAEAKVALREKASPGMKRKRSSQANTNLEGTLPALADALYEHIGKKDFVAVRSLCAEGHVGASVAAWAEKAAKKNLAPGTKHVSARTATIHIDVTVGGVSAVHKLEFDDDGLITKSEVFTLSK